MAFKIAGSMAFKEACHRASPVLLEPIMKVEVVVPEEYMPQVFGDLNARRSAIQGTENRAGSNVIRVKCRSRRCSVTPRICAAARRPRHVHHAFFTLCRSAGFDRSGSDREGDRQGGQIIGFCGQGL